MRDPRIHSATWEWDHAPAPEQWQRAHNDRHHSRIDPYEEQGPGQPPEVAESADIATLSAHPTHSLAQTGMPSDTEQR